MSYEYMEDVVDWDIDVINDINITEKRESEMKSAEMLNNVVCRSIRKSVKKIEDEESQKTLDYIEDMKRYLSPDMIRRVYIWWFRLYWRSYIPLTAKVPVWQKRKNYVDRVLWDSRLKNIHLLHMPFNTLDQNKEWIMGCQCPFCKKGGNISNKRKRFLVKKAEEEEGYFQSVMPEENNYYEFMNMNGYISVTNKPGLKGNYHYDPLYGSPYECVIKWSVRNPKRTLEFSYTKPIVQSSDPSEGLQSTPP